MDFNEVVGEIERAEPVILQLEDPLGVIEGQRSARQRYGLECHSVGRIAERGAKMGFAAVAFERGARKRIENIDRPKFCSRRNRSASATGVGVELFHRKNSKHDKESHHYQLRDQK